jgi:DNA segregation ATPase FtsK/SpoIIIE, S-DNA-T family
VARYWPDVVGFVLMGAALTSLLAVFRPEGSLAEPLNQLLSRALGWLAAAAPVWLAAGSALLIARRNEPWPWIRIVAAGAGTFALLGLADLEALRRGIVLDAGGGGFVGHAVATALAGWIGISSAAIVLLAIVVGSVFVVTGLRPAQVFRAGRWLGSGAWQAVAAVASRVRRPRLQINSAGVRVPRPLRPPRHASSAPPADEIDPVEPPVARGQPGGWKTPPLTMFQRKPGAEPVVGELKEQARVIEETLASFNIDVRVAEVNQGPAVTQYGLEPAVGVPVSRITARLNDLALRLGASPIRMEAPVPGRRVVGIEVPNQTVSVVHFREVLENAGTERLRARIPLALGKDIGGKVKIGDLARMPHLLIAGATGSGKSVCINSIVACLLTQFTPDDLQLIMIDPKMVELAGFNGVPHLRMPVVVEMDKVVGTLKWVTLEMERRYKLFAAHSARNIDGYNRAVRGRADGEKPLSNMVLIIDELADLMMTAPEEAERTICRLAQLARATGIHLVVATQRPSVDVLTGLIKANFPTRIAFAVTSQVDSRVILDTVGAERLLGRGDMLYLPPDSGKPIRLQGTYVSDDEIESLVAYWRGLGRPQYDDDDLAEVENLGRPVEPDADDLYDRAVAVAQESRRISVSLLQRRLGIGYPRAARLVDLLEERGIVSAPVDGRTREVMSESRYADD